MAQFKVEKEVSGVRYVRRGESAVTRRCGGDSEHRAGCVAGGPSCLASPASPIVVINPPLLNGKHQSLHFESYQGSHLAEGEP